MSTAIYVRVSTEHQDHDSQLQACKQYAEHFPSGNILYVDTASGSTMNRLEVQRLLEDIRKGIITKLIVYEMSRLTRDMMTTGLLMQELHTHSCELHVVADGGLVNTGGALNQFVALAKGLTAQIERERIGQRTKAGLRAAKIRGVTLGAPKGNQNRKGKRKLVDKVLQDKVLKLQANGFSIQKMAEILDCNYSKIQRISKRLK